MKKFHMPENPEYSLTLMYEEATQHNPHPGLMSVNGLKYEDLWDVPEHCDHTIIHDIINAVYDAAYANLSQFQKAHFKAERFKDGRLRVIVQELR